MAAIKLNMSFLKYNAQQISAMDVEEIKNLRNSVHNCMRDLLRPSIERLYLIMPGITNEDDSASKSPKKSIEYRESGNNLYLKENHGTSDHKMILYFYSKSIAYAPPDSEELAKAYGNRSALWLHLQRYDLCISDIDRSLQVTRCNNLREKLSARKNRCMELSQGSQSVRKRKVMKLPEFEPSKLVPCAADSIALVVDDEHGRHYIATRDIKLGEIIMVEESPFINVKNDQIYFVCSHCFAFAWAGIPCDSCVFTMYCSEYCKRESWQRYHDNMCSRLPTLQTMTDAALDLFPIINMSTRIIDIFIKKDGLKAILKEAEKIDNDSRAGNSNSAIFERELDCRSFASLYSLSNCKIIDKYEPASLFTVRDKLTYINNSNAFQYVAEPQGGDDASNFCSCENFETCLEKDCSIRGSILGVCSSLMNHSCMPNATRIFLPGPKIVFLTEKPVKKGEQIFVSYGPSADTQSKASRQDTLRKNWVFECKCNACKQNLPDRRPYKTPNAPEKRLIDSRILKAFRKYARMLEGPTEDWHYNQKLLKASIEVCESFYDHFDDWRAYTLSSRYRLYMKRCFTYLYTTDTDVFPSAC